MPPSSYHIVFNPNAGTALASGLDEETLRQGFERLGAVTTIDADDRLPLEERIEKALASDAEVIVSAGGDGTATALAQALVGTDKTLAILPLGTANLLARDLKLPLDLDAAIAALNDMQPRRIDVGEVNGRLFLHKVVIGVIPAIAAGREQLRGRKDLGAKLAFARYMLHRLARARRMAVAIASGDEGDRVERITAIAVANNAYDEGFGRVFTRQRLDRGQLSLYILRHLTIMDAVRLAFEMVTGHWREDEALVIESVRSATIRTRRRRVPVMIDGEVDTLEAPLQFTIRPLALSILAPLEEEQAVEEPAVDAIAAGP